MKNEPLQVKSPHLKEIMSDLMARTALGIRELADRAGLSYGYMRRIVNGTVIPNRDALKRLCDAFELDFSKLWRLTRNPVGHQDDAEPIVGDTIMEVKSTRVEFGDDTSPTLTLNVTKDQAATASALFRQQLLESFDRMTFASRIELLSFALKLEQEHRNWFKT